MIVKKALKFIWEKWKAFARLVGVFNSKVLLTLFYFIPYALFGTIMIITRRDPLRVRRIKGSTAWIKRNPDEKDVEKLKRLT